MNSCQKFVLGRESQVKQGMQEEEERKEEEGKEEEEEEGGEIGNYLEELPRPSLVFLLKCRGNKEPLWFGLRSRLHSLPGLFWLHKCVLLPLPNRTLHSFRSLALLGSLQSEGSSPVLVCRCCSKQVFPWGFRRQRQGFGGDPKAVGLGSIWKKVIAASRES